MTVAKTRLRGVAIRWRCAGMTVGRLALPGCGSPGGDVVGGRGGQAGCGIAAMLAKTAAIAAAQGQTQVFGAVVGGRCGSTGPGRGGTGSAALSAHTRRGLAAPVRASSRVHADRSAAIPGSASARSG